MRYHIYSDLVNILGETGANHFIQEFGGRKVWISAHPHRVDKRSGSRWRDRFEAMFGVEVAARLCAAFNGWLNIPKTSTKGGDPARKRKAMELRKAGMRINDVADRVGVNRRTIFRWLNERHDGA